MFLKWQRCWAENRESLEKKQKLQGEKYKKLDSLRSYLRCKIHTWKYLVVRHRNSRYKLSFYAKVPSLSFNKLQYITDLIAGIIPCEWAECLSSNSVHRLRCNKTLHIGPYAQWPRVKHLACFIEFPAATFITYQGACACIMTRFITRLHRLAERFNYNLNRAKQRSVCSSFAPCSIYSFSLDLFYVCTSLRFTIMIRTWQPYIRQLYPIRDLIYFNVLISGVSSTDERLWLFEWYVKLTRVRQNWLAKWLFELSNRS